MKSEKHDHYESVDVAVEENKKFFFARRAMLMMNLSSSNIYVVENCRQELALAVSLDDGRVRFLKTKFCYILVFYARREGFV